MTVDKGPWYVRVYTKSELDTLILIQPDEKTEIDFKAISYNISRRQLVDVMDAGKTLAVELTCHSNIEFKTTCKYSFTLSTTNEYGMKMEMRLINLWFIPSFIAMEEGSEQPQPYRFAWDGDYNKQPALLPWRKVDK